MAPEPAPHRRLRARFDRDVAAGDLAPLMTELAEELATSVARRDGLRLSALGATVSRLARRAERSGSDVALAEVPALRQMLRVVRSALAQIDHRRDVTELQPTVTDRALDLLRRSDRPLRSAVIAESLGIARAQASRSLNELVSRGAIRRAEAGVTDRRAIAYEAVAAASA